MKYILQRANPYGLKFNCYMLQRESKLLTDYLPKHTEKPFTIIWLVRRYKAVTYSKSYEGKGGTLVLDVLDIETWNLQQSFSGLITTSHLFPYQAILKWWIVKKRLQLQEFTREMLSKVRWLTYKTTCILGGSSHRAAEELSSLLYMWSNWPVAAKCRDQVMPSAKLNKNQRDQLLTTIMATKLKTASSDAS